MNKRKAHRKGNDQNNKTNLTYAPIGRPSPGVVGVWWVKLGARLQARRGHGIWAGHRYFTWQKTRLGEDRDKVLLIIHKRAWKAQHKQLLYKEMKTVDSKCLTWKEKWENEASFINTFFSHSHMTIQWNARNMPNVNIPGLQREGMVVSHFYLQDERMIVWILNASETLSCIHM